MITECRIQNFKCFKDLSLSELRRITIIGGRNNVGKTALLEGLFLLFDRLTPLMISRQYAWRGIEKVAAEPEAMWAPVFYDFDMTNDILVSASVDEILRSAKFRYNREFVPPQFMGATPLNGREVPTTAKSVTSSAIDIEYETDNNKRQTSHVFVGPDVRLTLHTDYVRTISPAHFFASKHHIPSKETADNFSKLAKEERENEIIQFLKMIEPRLVTLKVITQGPVLSVHGKLRGVSRMIPVHLMGEGMEKLLNLILAIASSPGSCIFVDEFENGLHYSILRDIWRSVGYAAMEYGCQIVATTHSYECLASAVEGLVGMPEEFRYVRLERTNDMVSAKISDYDMVKTAIKSNLEVR